MRNQSARRPFPRHGLRAWSCSFGLALVALMACMTSGGAWAQHQAPQQIAFKQTTNASGEDVTLYLYLFTPQGWTADDRRPAAVFFFGGGWVSGSPAQFYPHCRELAARGMVAISAEYRVANKHGTTPRACVADGKSAIRYVRAHADELGIDPEMLAAGGGSAGGHVAAATALVAGFEEPGEDATVSCVPDLLLLFNPVIETIAPDGYGTSRLGDDAKALSPTEGVHADQPPSVIFHGTADTTVPIRTVRRFKQLSDKAGAACVVHEYDGRGHGFFNMRDAKNPDAPANADYRDSVEKMIGFLAEHSYLEPETKR